MASDAVRPCHREILVTIGRKYDQYLGFQQQDAHEFLRHILDAMRMEEVDVSFLSPSFHPTFLNSVGLEINRAWRCGIVDHQETPTPTTSETETAQSPSVLHHQTFL